MPFCKLCEKTIAPDQISLIVRKTHHTSSESLHRSKTEFGCEICIKLWNSPDRRKIEFSRDGKAEDSSDDSSYGLSSYATSDALPDGLSDGSSDNQYYGIQVTRQWDELTFRYRAIGGGYKTILVAFLEETDSGTRCCFDEEKRTKETTVSEENFDIIKTWISKCSETHKECNAPQPPEVTLPTRLIWIRRHPRLVTSDKLPGGTRYIALSHCWGLKPIFSLRKAILDDLLERIPVEKLPKTFRDAMLITMKLGIHYIWIDSLCIIQDSEDDWQHEASRMQYVYSSCWLNLAATGFHDGSRGMITKKIMLGWQYDEGDYWIPQVEKAPMNQRAWVMQERLLSPRTLHFGVGHIAWECRLGGHDQKHPDWNQTGQELLDIASAVTGVKGQFWGTYYTGTEDYFKNWTKIISWYNKLRLTKEEDRIVAIGGVANFFKPKLSTEYWGGLNCEYVAGLWKTEAPEKFLAQLDWKVHTSYEKERNIFQDKEEDIVPSWRRRVYCGPTWSWVAVTGLIDIETTRVNPIAVVEGIDVDLKGPDPMGAIRSATLHIRGPLLKATIRWKSGQKKWPSKYDMRSSLRLEINGSNEMGFAAPDACIEGSNLIDFGPGPLDTDSTYTPSAHDKTTSREPLQEEEAMETYLLGLSKNFSHTNCLWLRPTGRRKNEFQRIGTIELCTHMKGADEVVKLV
jgi:hypothetical protein